jgi:hypothetical protein
MIVVGHVWGALRKDASNLWNHLEGAEYAIDSA